MRHNNVIPNVHFHKNYKPWIKTWYNQAGRKKSRRISRQKLIAKSGLRPTDLLRPIVHSPTQRYNMKVRLGRGFTLEELSACGLNKQAAKSIGIAVDHRRTNLSEESLKTNVARLKKYMDSIVMFPRSGKKPKKGFAGIPDDYTKKGSDNFKSVKVEEVFPLKSNSRKQKAHTITVEERRFASYVTLRKELLKSKNIGKKNKQKA
ncbi:60S ribosomal protein L13, putative [Cryptosporidium muris RN66]|uniref:60S ribosomal protein L13 n=1 Tax=Cryptosporidium muris (strain RN66) TaxID=441375 RepID=B6AK18_CRYMR|nr:60S ribosomal protein L13, putative [Cryptosporidium muris RN66]EEA08559.1 60S ribosomal protein L13, putative [Cryptosporidium muris RN66]|eukprot:XP_002142908.1 60S ribosomal protein L13 [Cryptosporidium muris RN66]